MLRNQISARALIRSITVVVTMRGRNFSAVVALLCCFSRSNSKYFNIDVNQIHSNTSFLTKKYYIVPWSGSQCPEKPICAFIQIKKQGNNSVRNTKFKTFNILVLHIYSLVSNQFLPQFPFYLPILTFRTRFHAKDFGGFTPVAISLRNFL